MTTGIGEFLRARRALVRPADVGLLPGGRRQVPGLRREEVARLAGVSTDYYVQLEQGREVRPSAQVLDALADVLRLDPATHRHLLDLAAWRSAARAEVTDPDDSLLVAMVQGWTLSPALLVTPWLDVVARNDAAVALYSAVAERDNLARMSFLDEHVGDLVPDVADLQQCTAATLRAAAGPAPRQTPMAALLDDLERRSPSFRQWWSRHDAHVKGTARKTFTHPVTGPLILHQHVMTLADRPDRQMWVYQAEAGSASERALAELVPMTAGSGTPQAAGQSR